MPGQSPTSCCHSCIDWSTSAADVGGSEAKPFLQRPFCQAEQQKAASVQEQYQGKRKSAGGSTRMNNRRLVIIIFI